MKKIIIFYGSYGGGHLSAARSIKEYIDANYTNTETHLIDCIEYINKALNKITTKAYSEMAKNAHWVWKKVYYGAENGAIAKMSNTTQKLLAIKLIALVRKLVSILLNKAPIRNDKPNIKIKIINLAFSISTVVMT